MGAVCRKCERDIPDKKIGCPWCLGRRNAEARRSFQLAPVLAVSQGKGEFTVHKGGHAQLFGPFSARAFCGEEVHTPRAKRYPVAYASPAYGDRLCPKCREAIEEILVEARTAEAIREESLQ